jgi:hypothetical protein
VKVPLSWSSVASLTLSLCLVLSGACSSGPAKGGNKDPGAPAPGSGGSGGASGSGAGGAPSGGAGGTITPPGGGGSGGTVTPPGTGGGAGPAPDGPARPTDGGTGPAPDAPPAATGNAVTIDPPGATFAGMQMVKLVPAKPGSPVHFTVDGSLPTRASPAYTAPLMIAQTSIVRAFAEDGAANGPVAAAVFVAAAADVASFTSDLPIILLHTHKSGVLTTKEHGPYVDASVSVFEPATGGGRASLMGTATLSSRSSMRVRGSSSTGFPQKGYAVELRHPGTDGDDDRIFAGLPSESDWALVAPSRTDRALIRNTLFYALSNDIGRYAPRVRPVEVFLVETGGQVARRDYLGVYQLTEKIKQAKNRVAIAKLEATDLTEPLLSGGYVFRIDHVSRTIPPHFFVASFPFEIKDPDWDDIGMPARAPQRTYLQNYLQEFFDAIARPDFKNPRTGKRYSEYIDVPSFIDHNLLVILSKNVDALKYSAYFHKDRGGLVKAGPLWDFDRTAGTRWDDDFGRRTEEPREWARADATHPLTWGYWPRLFADPAFKAAHRQRWMELVQGPFSVANVHQLIDRLAAQVKDAQARHFARWTEMPPSGGSHDAEIKILKDWFAARIPWVTSQL